MSLDTLGLAILALAIGALVCFVGFKFFLVLLPIWAFFVGLLAGAEAFTALFGDGFLSTVTGWIVGAVLGIAFAIFSYLFYWVAVVFLGGTIGYMLGSGLLAQIGIDSNVLLVVAGLALGAVFAVAAAILRAPKYLVIVLTAFGGSAAIMAGVLLLFGGLHVSDLQHGIVRAALYGISQNIFWAIVWAVVGAAGAVYQVISTSMQESLETTGYRYA